MLTGGRNRSQKHDAVVISSLTRQVYADVTAGCPEMMVALCRILFLVLGSHLN
jgi:hypothetical protein